jgi:hypothetical protein
MFWWLPRRRARIKRLDAEAEALICELGADAYAEARRKECEASSDTIAKDWGRVALAVAKRTGLDVAHRTPRDADVALENESVAPSEFRSSSEPSPLDRLNSSVFARSQQFRVQFVGAAHGREPLLLKEVGIEAADVSAAVVAAASLTLPPKTNGLHILDREGRVVFARERTNPRLQSLGRLEPRVSLSGLRSWGLSLWRRAVKTRHLFLSYVHNVQTRGRGQAVQHHARWKKLGDKMSGSHFALVGQALGTFEAMETLALLAARARRVCSTYNHRATSRLYRH